jgi:two-component system, NarL family, response regulator NreC
LGIRILLVHSLKLFREALKSLLDDETDLAVIGQAEGAGEAVRLTDELSASVIIFEASMPGPSAIESARQILRNRPDAKVLFLSSFEDEDVLFECMQAGAAGFLSKDASGADLVCAIRQVSRGGKYLTAPSLDRFVDSWRSRKRSGGNDPASLLTAREREVLKLLAEGNSVKECAGVLNVSAKTIEAHKFNLMRKLDIHNKAQLVHYAYQKKIVRLPLLAS